MKLRPGEQLVRLTAMTPAHLGSAAGETLLDRPTQKDAWHELPFVPDSALKGVLAGRHGDVDDDEPNAKREDLFGSPDRAGGGTKAASFGRPGPLVIGNGELLAFPVPCTGGAPAWIVPVTAVAWALRVAGAAGRLAGAMRALNRIDRSGKVLALPHLPRLAGPVAPRQLREYSVHQEAPVLLQSLRRLAGPALPEDGALLFAPAGLAADLWRQAAEYRTLVALDGETRTVADRALRRVELIPAGTVFLSLVTCLDETVAGDGMPRRFQVGAWESLGLGWFEADLVEGAAEEPLPEVSPAAAGEDGRVAESRIMADARQAVDGLEGLSPSLLKKLRAVVRGFGGRAQFGGLEAALAFELAKAKPEQARPSEDARAHRWLLTALFTPNPGPPAETGPSGRIREWLGKDPFAPGALDAQRAQILTRWLWLARFLEFGPEEETA